MWRKRQTEQLMLLQEQRGMDDYLSLLLNDTVLDINQVHHLFLEQYPEQEHYMENFIEDYMA